MPSSAGGSGKGARDAHAGTNGADETINVERENVNAAYERRRETPESINKVRVNRSIARSMRSIVHTIRSIAHTVMNNAHIIMNINHDYMNITHETRDVVHEIMSIAPENRNEEGEKMSVAHVFTLLTHARIHFAHVPTSKPEGSANKMSEFEQQSVLARYKKEYAVLEEQIRLFTERHRALGQVIAGLEALLNIPEAGLSARISEPDEPDVALDRDPLLNAIAILRQDSRPLMAAEVRRRLEDHGIPIKPNTLYVAMVRGVRDGLLVHAYPGFALAERNKE